MTRQGALTVIAVIKPHEVEKLRELLIGIGDSVGKKTCAIDFDQLRTVHFMRWVIVDASQDSHGEPLPASLVLSTNYDEPLAEHLDDLIKVAGPKLDEIYRHCAGYHGLTGLRDYLQANSKRYAAFYVGTRGRSVKRIRDEERLRNAIEDFLDRPAQAGLASETPDIIRKQIQEFVFAEPELEWARTTPSRLAEFLSIYAKPIIWLVALLGIWGFSAMVFPWWLVPAMLGGALLAAAAVAGILLWLVIVQERRDRVDPIKNPIERVEKLVQREDQVVQNQLSHLVDVKPEWFRPIALWMILKAINLLASYWYVHGRLGSIPTIHFARWVILDRGRRLIFFSNYDGSWENYLGDFIDKAARGLTAVWSNTVGCPKAQGLIFEGARDEQRFKSWTRDHQIFTQAWYSAYKDLAVENINNNTKIRAGLHGKLSASETREWLSRL